MYEKQMMFVNFQPDSISYVQAFLIESRCKLTNIICFLYVQVCVFTSLFISSKQKMIYKGLNTCKTKKCGNLNFLKAKIIYSIIRKRVEKGGSYLSFWKGLDSQRMRRCQGLSNTMSIGAIHFQLSHQRIVVENNAHFCHFKSSIFFSQVWEKSIKSWKTCALHR